MTAPRIFLLSPAHCGGKRAAVLLNDRATFPLAERLRSVGLTLGEAFSFLSGLYFRGKLTYAGRFARPPAGCSGVQIITTDRGLVSADATIGPSDLREFGASDISVNHPQYRVPLQRDLARLEQFSAQVVLLGSVASNKYVDLLLETFGDRLLFPSEFVGRGDMSRGGLLLRAAEAGQELVYEPVAGAVRRGKRPPKLVPRPRRTAQA